jgi:hypothetical protein
MAGKYSAGPRHLSARHPVTLDVDFPISSHGNRPIIFHPHTSRQNLSQFDERYQEYLQEQWDEQIRGDIRSGKLVALRAEVPHRCYAMS